MPQCEFKGICYDSPLNSQKSDKKWCSDLNILKESKCVCTIRVFILEESNRIIKDGGD